MRAFIDDLDEIDFFNSARARRLHEKQRHRDEYDAGGRRGGRKPRRHGNDYDDVDDFGRYRDYAYDDDNFDAYPGPRRRQ